MIGWLKGQRIENWEQGSRVGLLLDCGGVGYEVQLVPKHFICLSSLQTFNLWIHQLQREDGESLIGFPERKERDLFRLLIRVNSVGPQIALALLEECSADELVEALINEDLKKLSKAQGVGKRTAERLSLELRSKLAGFTRFDQATSITKNNLSPTPQLIAPNLHEIHKTLSSLGYEDLEIHRAVKAVANAASTNDNKNRSTALTDDIDAMLKASLLWLSKETA